MMHGQSKGTLYIKIWVLAGISASIALGTWSIDVREHSVGIFVAGMIIAAALLGTFFLVISSPNESSVSSKP